MGLNSDGVRHLREESHLRRTTMIKVRVRGIQARVESSRIKIAKPQCHPGTREDSIHEVASIPGLLRCYG